MELSKEDITENSFTSEANIEKNRIDMDNSKDFVFWPEICSDQLILHLIETRPEKFQNKDKKFVFTIRHGQKCYSRVRSADSV